MTKLLIALILATVSPAAPAFTCYAGGTLRLLFPETVREVGLIRFGGHDTPVFCEGQRQGTCQIEDDGGRFAFEVDGDTVRLSPQSSLAGRQLTGPVILNLIPPEACFRMFPHRNFVEF